MGTKIKKEHNNLVSFHAICVLCFPKDNESHGAGAVVVEDRLSAAAVPPQQHPVGGQPAPFPGAAEGGVGEEEEGAGGQEAGQGQVQPQPAPRAHSGHEADAAGGGGDKEQQRGGVWVAPKDIFLPSTDRKKGFFLLKRRKCEDQRYTEITHDPQFFMVLHKEHFDCPHRDSHAVHNI